MYVRMFENINIYKYLRVCVHIYVREFIFRVYVCIYLIDLYMYLFIYDACTHVYKYA